jgi:indole-3-glycerol phosphate synthase/phosphoribosylanthranilate isomerase
VEKCRGFAPELTGINCRDLATFSLDLLHPVALRPRVDWPARVIFESGIRSRDDVLLARSAGFDGVLVGEAAMRHPEKLPELAAALTGTVPGQFWPRLCARKSPGRPLVKICGITDASDGERAARLGADALGFIFAPSKRRAGTEVVRALRGLDVPKVGVVVTDRISGTPRLDPGVAELAAEGLLDVLQFHGDETPDECADLAWPYYKAVRLRGAADVDSLGAYRSPRVLVDAWSAYSAGGTGTRVEHGLAQAARSAGPLWIAGGIHDGNVGEVMNRLSPELIDASSGLESSPGRKDPVKLERFFEEIRRHEKV